MTNTTKTTPPLKLSLGCSVAQIMPKPFAGVVDDVRIDEEALRQDPLHPITLVHVMYEDGTDEHGGTQTHGKWFRTDEVTVTKEAPPQVE